MRIFTCLAVIICMVLTASTAMANDENLPDTLMLEKIQAEKGVPVAVEVSFFNDQELAALTIPLGLVGDLYTIDSVSFAGSRVDYLKMKPITIAENKKEVVFGAICMTEDYIPAGRGLMATIYLSPTASAKSELCVIDTVTIGPASVLFTKKSSASFIPEFSSGMIAIGEAAKKEMAPQESESGDEGGNKKD